MTSDVVIIGAGPAGLFCADRLADKIGGQHVRVLDAGRPMAKRWCPATRACACRSCFVLEGEGGAGGFSDGKLPYSLTRGTQLEEIFDKSAEPLLWEIDRTVVELAGEGVWYDPAPDEGLPVGQDTWKEHFQQFGLQFSTYPLRHVGSDGVRRWSAAMTKRVEAKGVTIEYGDTVKWFRLGRPYNMVMGKDESIGADVIIIATGIQGIPWSEKMLTDLAVPLGPGPAGIGIRVETPAEDMAPLFDHFYDWKMVFDPDDSPLVLRSFCCNQRGEITNQWHSTMGVRGVNGHASLDPATRTKSSNFAIIAKVPQSYAVDPQAYVRGVARTINSLSGGHTACQWMSEFLDHANPNWSGRASVVDAYWRTNKTMARDGVRIDAGMPGDLAHQFRRFLRRLYDAVPSLSSRRSIIYAPEIKYPAKRVPVDFASWQVKDKPGLYVIGDASGYLDSFVAAAISGLIAADHIAAAGGQATDLYPSPSHATSGPGRFGPYD